jgi:hypothetical protein
MYGADKRSGIGRISRAGSLGMAFERNSRALPVIKKRKRNLEYLAESMRWLSSKTYEHDRILLIE